MKFVRKHGNEYAAFENQKKKKWKFWKEDWNSKNKS